MNDAGRIGFLIKGEYDNTETYDFLDVVHYNNSSYVAKKLTIGNPPANNNKYWQTLADAPECAVLGVKGNAENVYRTGNINITPGNIGAASSEYISTNFVPGYVSTVRTSITDAGWYRIAQVQSLEGYSCVISLKRRYNLPAPEYQKVQFLRAYTNVKFVPIASISDSHMWTKMRMTRDSTNGKDYIEVYQNRNSNSNMWVVTIEDALGTVAADHWKAMAPELTQETADSVTVVTSVNLPANLDLDFYAKKDGSNVTGTWSNLTAGNAIKATRDGNGSVIADTYAKKEWIYAGFASPQGGKLLIDLRNLSSHQEFLFVLWTAPDYNELEVYKNYLIPWAMLGTSEPYTKIYLHTEGNAYISVYRESGIPTVKVINDSYDYYVYIYAR